MIDLLREQCIVSCDTEEERARFFDHIESLGFLWCGTETIDLLREGVGDSMDFKLIPDSEVCDDPEVLILYGWGEEDAKRLGIPFYHAWQLFDGVCTPPDFSDADILGFLNSSGGDTDA